MNSHKPEDDITQLALDAGAAIRQQQSRTDVLNPTQPGSSKIKQVITLLLFLVFAAAAWIQYPRIQAPFGVLDPNQDVAVAQADLLTIASLVETYRMSQGSYPTNIDQVSLPESLASFVAQQKIAYRTTEKAYVLDWSLPRWRAVFDGNTGKVNVTPLAATK